MGNPSVYLSATDKLTFAKEMDELYAKQSLLRSSPTPTREIVDALLLQVPTQLPKKKPLSMQNLKPMVFMNLKHLLLKVLQPAQQIRVMLL